MLREKCPYSECFWAIICRIRPECGYLLCKSSECGNIRCRKTRNTDTLYAVIANSNYKDLARRIEPDKVLLYDKAFEIISNPQYDGY